MINIKEPEPHGTSRFINIAAMMSVCLVLYYAYYIFGALGYDSLSVALNRLHDFYGIDFYALAFFAPVVYAAHVAGIREALLTAIAAVVLILPSSFAQHDMPVALLRPAAFGIILNAIGATIAMLQNIDQERRITIHELSCLYEISKVADECVSPDDFIARVSDVIRRNFAGLGEFRVRINIGKVNYESPGFTGMGEKVSKPVVVAGKAVGNVEVSSILKNARIEKQDVFAEVLAEKIVSSLRRLELEQSLREYSEQLENMVEARTRDLTAAQGQLRLLSNTVKSSFDGITLASMDGKLTFANEAAQRMWGMTADELLSMKMSALYNKVNSEFIEREIIPTSNTKLWNGELTAMRKTGTEFPALITIAPVRDEAGDTVAIVGVHRDITETKVMRDKLIRSERLAAVGEMASSVGHELRNPLNVIENCTYLLRMMLAEKLDNETKGTLDLLDRQVTAANDIVTDLLDFTRIRQPALAATDINLLLKDVLSTFNPPSRIRVITGFSEVPPLALVDKGQAGRAFLNLITNAAQSIREEGEVRVLSRNDDDNVEVAVEDTGCGISPENLEKLFEPLFSTKPNGTGLGLAIAKKFIERNGG